MARNPKDTVVSYYFFDQMNKTQPEPGPWPAYLQRFMRGERECPPAPLQRQGSAAPPCRPRLALRPTRAREPQRRLGDAKPRRSAQGVLGNTKPM